MSENEPKQEKKIESQETIVTSVKEEIVDNNNQQNNEILCEDNTKKDEEEIKNEKGIIINENIEIKKEENEGSEDKEKKDENEQKDTNDKNEENEDKKEEVKIEDKEKEEVKIEDKENEDKKEEVKIEDKENEDKKEEEIQKEEKIIENKIEEEIQKEEKITENKKEEELPKENINIEEKNEEKINDVKEEEKELNTEKQNEEDIKENIEDEKKETIKEKEKDDNKEIEEKKEPSSTRKRYTFYSDNKDLNIEKPKKNIIIEKKNHQISITIVPSKTKEEFQLKVQKNINQSKNNPQITKMPNKLSNTNTQNSIIKKYQKTNPINIKNKNNNIKEKIDEKNKPKIENKTYLPKQKNINQIIVQTKVQNNPINKSQVTKDLKNQKQTIIFWRNNFTSPISQSRTVKEIKEIKTQTKNEPKKYEIIKTYKNIASKPNLETTKRIVRENSNKIYTNNSFVNITQKPNITLSSNYNIKKSEPPTPDSKSKKTQRIYPHIKIDLSKYNTEKKGNNSKISFFNYNSRTIDTNNKHKPNLKYYDICPKCGYHLN